MNHPKMTRLEDLPTEILIEIFEYFSGNELYLSFAQLNSRLNSILKFLPNLFLVSTRHIDPHVLSFFYAFKAILTNYDYILRIYHFYEPYYIKGGNRLFQIYPSLDIHWYPHPQNGIENIVRPNICSQLQSLFLAVTPPGLVQSIFNGEFPRLEICHLGQCKPLVLPLSTTIERQSLRQLTIREQYGCALETILSLCPSLIYLDFSCNDVISPFILTTVSFSSTKYLRLGRLERFLFHNGQFDFLLSLFPNLHQFHLTVNQCHQHNEIIQFEKIAECLRHRLPLLKILDLRIYTTHDMRYPLGMIEPRVLSQMHSLFKYIEECKSLLMITSYGFVPNYCYIRRYARLLLQSSYSDELMTNKIDTIIENYIELNHFNE